LREKKFDASGKHRVSLEYIRKKFLEAGYTLISDECRNNKQLLDYECSNGHKRKIRWNDFQQKHRCSECQNMHSPSISYVKKVFDERGYVLLSKVFENAHKELDYICPEGHVGKITWHSFRKKCGCAECGGTKRKTIDEVWEIFSNVGIELLSTEYKNSSTKLIGLCKNDHVFYTSISSFRFRCPICSIGPVSKMSQKWLDAVRVSEREVSIFAAGKKLIVDGFDQETNTVYEFFGDYWHGNPNVYNQDVVNQNNKKTFGELFDETLERLFLLRQIGYNLNIIWEEDFLRSRG